MEAHVAAPPGGLPRLAPVRLRPAGDERLAKLVASGSEAAFTVLFERFHQPLYRYCRSLLGNDADAQDALQTTFTRALVALREGRRDAPLRPWLYRIAHNESISLLRRRRPAQKLPPDAGGAERPADEIVEERVRLATLLADLRDLPERQRGALTMRELSGLPHEEIALAFGISVGAAKQTVLEARRSLQEFAEGRTMACEEIQQTVSDGDRRALRGRRVRAHLRDCATCRSFAAAISSRQADLRALAPGLPVAAASGLLARVTGAGPGHGGGGTGLAVGTTSKAVGIAASAKTVATGAAVVAVAAVGAGAVHHLVARNGRVGAGSRAASPASVAARPGAKTPGHVPVRAMVHRSARAAPALAVHARSAGTHYALRRAHSVAAVAAAGARRARTGGTSSAGTRGTANRGRRAPRTRVRRTAHRPWPARTVAHTSSMPARWRAVGAT